MPIKPFLDQDFLLENKTAAELYHDYAAHLPIIDYHNHLSPQAIVEDINFDSITQAWLQDDHYKWRAMRTFGIDEKYITGPGTDWEKFAKWAETIPSTIRNPLFHWTHLELQRYFDISALLSPTSAQTIYEQTNEHLKDSAYSTQNLLRKMQVEWLCTTDDPVDGLGYHIRAQGMTTPVMSMTFRPDNALLIEREYFPNYISQLEAATDVEIKSFKTLMEALLQRMDYFHRHGCRLSDHGLSRLHALPFTEVEIDTILEKRLKGKVITSHEQSQFKSAVLLELCRSYSDRGWIQQFHLGAIRNTNERRFNALGADAGCDSIGDDAQARSLAAFLNQLDRTDQLAKTILYNLNPGDNEVFAAMIGNFNDGSVRGKIQYGSAWWFLDQKDGMEKQINALSNMGLLSCFIGMLTDSRSFLSFPRHEYFRRILCNLIGRDVHNGELPHDLPWLGKIVSDICYFNAKNYFEL